MASAYTWRLGNDALVAGAHYDVGQWPTGADITDARQFSIVECWFDQVSAARRATAFNSGTAAGAGWIAIGNTAGSKPKPK